MKHDFDCIFVYCKYCNIIMLIIVGLYKGCVESQTSRMTNRDNDIDGLI